MDAWTAVGDGSICQISLRNLGSNQITNYAFDGFQRGYPSQALQCTSALIKCAQDDWVCNVKPGVLDGPIIAAIKWVCSFSGGNVDCGPINQGGAHYLPNTARAHGNWALNEYYQRLKLIGGITACDFNGIGVVVPKTPSLSRLLKFQKSKNALEGILSQYLVC